MFFEALAMLAVATSPTPTPTFTGEMVGYKQRNDNSRWERFDLQLTNETDEAQELGICAKHADMVLRTKQASTRSAFAIKFDDEAWSFGCKTRSIAAGESTTVSMYFRPAFEFGPSRYISLKTNKGDFLIAS